MLSQCDKTACVCVWCVCVLSLCVCTYLCVGRRIRGLSCCLNSVGKHGRWCSVCVVCVCVCVCVYVCVRVCGVCVCAVLDPYVTVSVFDRMQIISLWIAPPWRTARESALTTPPRVTQASLWVSHTCRILLSYSCVLCVGVLLCSMRLCLLSSYTRESMQSLFNIS